MDELPGWPEPIKEIQRHWIGKSHGVAVDFGRPRAASPTANVRCIAVYGESDVLIFSGSLQLAPLKVFTTRLDTLLGVTFVVGTLAL